MRIIDITSLQEPNESQFGILLAKEVKERLKSKGWHKGSKIAINEHGAGIYIHLIGDQQSKELEAAMMKTLITDNKEKPKGGKRA
jgi:hypothetical protein